MSPPNRGSPTHTRRRRGIILWCTGLPRAPPKTDITVHVVKRKKGKIRAATTTSSPPKTQVAQIGTMHDTYVSRKAKEEKSSRYDGSVAMPPHQSQIHKIAHHKSPEALITNRPKRASQIVRSVHHKSPEAFTANCSKRAPPFVQGAHHKSRTTTHPKWRAPQKKIDTKHS